MVVAADCDHAVTRQAGGGRGIRARGAQAPAARAEPTTNDNPATEVKDAEPEPPEPRSVTVALTGDVLVHTGVWQTAERDARAQGETVPDFAPMFAGLEPLVAPADLAICHLETPVSRPGGPYRNYPVFSAPPEVLDGLVTTGYDACTTASNHSVDTGFTGLVRTADALDARGLAHTGTYAERRRAGRPVELEVDGVRIGLISMTFGTNGLPVTEPWSVNLIDVPRAIAQAKAMHQDGVDVVGQQGDVREVAGQRAGAGPGSGVEPRLRIVAAHERHDVLAALHEPRRDVGAEEAGRAGDEDAHAGTGTATGAPTAL